MAFLMKKGQATMTVSTDNQRSAFENAGWKLASGLQEALKPVEEDSIEDVEEVAEAVEPAKRGRKPKEA